MNLAQDLLRKSQGHIHTMPKSIMTNRQMAILGISNRPATGNSHVTDNGKGYAFDQAVFSQSKGQFGFEITDSECDAKEAIEGVCHAINVHDAQAERIEKLEAALGVARDYLKVNTDTHISRAIVMKCDEALKGEL